MREPLQPDLVDAGLSEAGSAWPPVQFHDRVTSTNDLLREATHTGVAAPWTVILADEQRGGRGRLGRAWSQPYASSLISSVSMPLTSPAHAGWVPLVAGLALAEAIEAVAAGTGAPSVEPVLKWPNDVLLRADGERKVAGILCELVPDADSVVVGCGVNVDQTRDELPVPTATSLALAGLAVTREALAVVYLTKLRRRLEMVDGSEGTHEHAWGTAASDYRAACTTLGADVQVHTAGQVLTGRAVQIDDEGRLVVEHGPGKRRAYSAGDVTHLRPGGAPLA